MEKIRIMLTVYRITKMSGRTGKELIDEALYYRKVFDVYNITVLDPVLKEDIPYTDEIVNLKDEALFKRYWEEDKRCLREANVAINCNAIQKSIGGEREHGIMRWGYWKPVVLIFEDLPFISRYEDDVVCSDIYTACYLMKQQWGTWRKRFVWRLHMLNRCLPKFIWRQWRFLWQ